MENVKKKGSNFERKTARAIIMLPVPEVRPYEKNPRKNAEAVKYVKASIEKFGFKQPIIVDSNRVIIAGHTRLEAAKSLGMAEVPCIVADDLTEAQAKALRLADNKVAEFSELEMNLLGEELGELAEISDIDMGDFGFDLSEFDNIGMDDEETEVVEDEAPEEVEPVCKKGEIWQLGEHRLMCGDSTSADDVALLMNGERADIVLTDPPYGISVVNEDGKIGGGSLCANGIYMPIKGDETTDTARQNFDIIKCLSDKQIIFGGNYFLDFLPPSPSWIIWDKKGDMESNNFADGEMAWCSFHTPVRIFRQVWRGMIKEGENGKRVHPTQKPVNLLGRILTTFSKDGNIVLDCFGGSGSTLIACEQINRKCRMIEYEPHYCDVIIARWEKLTGQKAVKL